MTLEPSPKSQTQKKTVFILYPLDVCGIRTDWHLTRTLYSLAEIRAFTALKVRFYVLVKNA